MGAQQALRAAAGGEATAAYSATGATVEEVLARAVDLITATGAPRAGAMAAGTASCVVAGIEQSVLEANLARTQARRPVRLVRAGDAAALSAPLVTGGEVLGVVVAARHPGDATPFDEEHQRLLVTIANQTAAALAGAAGGPDLDRASRTSELLRAVAVIANETDTVEAALQAAIGRICEAMSWPLGHALTRDPDQGGLVPTDIWHLDRPDRLAEFQAVSEITAGAGTVALPHQVLATGEPAWTNDLGTTDLRTRAPTGRRELRGAVAFPILAGSEVVGVLEFFLDHPRPLDGSIVEVMTAVGAQLGRVVERRRARLREARAAAALELANRELVAANQLKTNFLTMVSHELRTPLTPILGYAGLLVQRWDTIPDGVKASYVQVMEAQARHLALLVDELLTMTQIDAGRVGARSEAVALFPAIETAVAEVAPAGSDVRIRCAPDVYVRTDPSHLRRILIQLLRNAFEHGAPPVDVIGYQAPGGEVVVRVEDRGPGVPGGFTDHLFEKFSQGTADPARSRGSGLGLGLSVVRGLVEALGGRVWHEERRPSGAVFAVALPDGLSPRGEFGQES